MVFVGTVLFVFSRSCEREGGGRGSVLSLWIATNSIHVDELDEEATVVTHESDDSVANLVVLVLMTENLIRESIEETITCRSTRCISYYPSYKLEAVGSGVAVLTIASNFAGFQAKLLEQGELSIFRSATHDGQRGEMIRKCRESMSNASREREQKCEEFMAVVVVWTVRVVYLF
jgi:hypothetical protein